MCERPCLGCVTVSTHFTFAWRLKSHDCKMKVWGMLKIAASLWMRCCEDWAEYRLLWICRRIWNDIDSGENWSRAEYYCLRLVENQWLIVDSCGSLRVLNLRETLPSWNERNHFEIIVHLLSEWCHDCTRTSCVSCVLPRLGALCMKSWRLLLV